MALNFNKTPVHGEQYSHAGRTWRFDETIGTSGAWRIMPVSTSDADLAAAFAEDAANASRLEIGTVTTGAPGTSAAATIEGPAGDQSLSLVIPRGDPGTPVELRQTATHIQWRLYGLDAEWTDLTPLSAIEGPPGKPVELRLTATDIEWRLQDGAWGQLVAIETLRTPTRELSEAAAASADAAAASAATASTKASEAVSSATSASNSAATAATKAGEAISKAGEAADSAATATSRADEAFVSAGVATAKAGEASSSASAAAADASDAQDLANLARSWATSTTAEVVIGEGYGAKKYAQDAAASAASATDAQATAVASAATAVAKAGEATVSAESAGEAATVASTKAGEAAASADAAQASAASIVGDAAAAATSASNAQAAAISASASATTADVKAGEATAGAAKAGQWANADAGAEVEPGKYSAKHWALQAQASATGALIYRGSHDASSGAYPGSPALGDYYKVSGPGTIEGVAFALGDSMIYNGSGWDKIDSTDEVSSVAGRTGNVILSSADVGLDNVDNTPDLAKPISSAQQAALNEKVDKIAGKGLSAEDYTTAEKDKLAGVAAGATANATDAQLRDRATHTGAQAISTVTGLQGALDAKAPLASPALTGVPTAPTAAAGTNTTQLATTAYSYAVATAAPAVWNSFALNVTTADTAASAVVRNASGTGDSGVAALGFLCQGAYGVKLYLRADGFFGLGGWSKAAWGWYIDPSNNMTVAGNVTAYSDPRLKKNFKRVADPMAILDQLDGGTFTWRKGFKHTAKKAGKRDYGILADQVQAVMPEIVNESIEINGKSYLTVAYDKLVPVLIEAVKELNARVRELEGK